MNFTKAGLYKGQQVRIKNLLPEIGIDKVRQEIAEGLNDEMPFISSKFFYNKVGSELFEEITKLEEYYPTRIEKKILMEIAPSLINEESSLELIELGSGDCSKISILLKAANNKIEDIKYIPVDFSESAIMNSANLLVNQFTELEIQGYVGDFTHQMHLIPHSNKKRIVCFLGSTIGNFSKTEAKSIMIDFANSMLENDTLLVGFDLVKPEPILHAAYNDSKGVTRRFNKNILSVSNNILNSDFCLDDFDHLAFYNQERSRIEMHLVASKKVVVKSPYLNEPVVFYKGKRIHTENSYKYTFMSIQELVKGTGLVLKKINTDKKNWFALVEFEKK